uniref:non-specific serine/threonine protein kinase n=1 Tax=Solanum tuberosum TaxID=4113 RepID=M1A019_SOLTU
MLGLPSLVQHEKRKASGTLFFMLLRDIFYLVSISGDSFSVLTLQTPLCMVILVLFRLLVYECVNNGNLEQWLHGAMQQHGYLTWEARMKILLGTAKA